MRPSESGRQRVFSISLSGNGRILSPQMISPYAQVASATVT